MSKYNLYYEMVNRCQNHVPDMTKNSIEDKKLYF